MSEFISYLKLLLESFDSPLKFTKRIKTDFEGLTQRGEFEVQNKFFSYRLEFKEKELYFSFDQIVNNIPTQEDINNLSNKEVLNVFSTVLEILKDYIQKADYILIEPSTVKKFDIYLKIVKNFNKQNNFKIVIHKPFDIEMFRLNKESSNEVIIQNPKRTFKFKKN